MIGNMFEQTLILCGWTGMVLAFRIDEPLVGCACLVATLALALRDGVHVAEE